MSNLHLFVTFLLSFECGVRITQPLLKSLKGLILQTAPFTVVLYYPGKAVHTLVGKIINKKIMINFRKKYNSLILRPVLRIYTVNYGMWLTTVCKLEFMTQVCSLTYILEYPTANSYPSTEGSQKSIHICG